MACDRSVDVKNLLADECMRRQPADNSTVCYIKNRSYKENDYLWALYVCSTADNPLCPDRVIKDSNFTNNILKFSLTNLDKS